MKKQLVLMVVMAYAIVSLIGCNAKDGLAGPPGTNGHDGMDANTSCLTCHTDSNWNLKTTQYNYSKHSLGTTAARGQGTKYCARCHTNDGFVEIVQNGQPWPAHEIPDALKIQCQTCHKMTSFDFTGDTVSKILRQPNPVVLNYLNLFDLNGWKSKNTYDFAQVKDSVSSKVNNLCVTCHQIRGATSFEYTDTVGGIKTTAYTQMAYFPLGTAITPGDTATTAKGNLKKPTDSVAYLLGRSFDVHDGNQSNLRYGINGYDFGTPITTAPRHHAKDNCTDCHMNAWDATTHTGGHSLVVNEDDPACAACHTMKLADTLALTQANIKTLLNQLGDLMVTRKMAKKTTSTSGVVSYTILPSHDFLGKLYSNIPADSTVLYTNIAAYNRTDSTTGVLKYANNITRTKDTDLKNRIGRKWTYGELGAAYNYGYINKELTFGSHNDEYARKLLQASITWLQTH